MDGFPTADQTSCANPVGRSHPAHPVLLNATGISKRFGTTQALHNASLTLHAGEVHVLLGENGAGKSTLAKIMAGVHCPDTGTLHLDGRQVTIPTAKAARKLGIATVFQELSLAIHLPVLDNLFLGREASHPFALLRRDQERLRCRQVLEKLAIDLPLHIPVRSLTIAQKQMLEIAKALLQRPRILIMDEPTSTITAREKQILFRVLQALKQEGVAILYVTHHLQDVFEIGTRVSAMLDGAIGATVAVTEDLTETGLLEMLTGRRNLSVAITRPASGSETVLKLQNLCTPMACADVSLHVQQGEIVGVYGVVGCGRESLGRSIVGLVKPDSGSMVLRGQPYQPRHPKHALSKGVGYLPMDRKEAGILPDRSIRENLNLSDLNAFATVGLLLSRQEQAKTTRSLENLRVRYASTEHPITHLSGGNQQKVLFGRAIASNPQLLVMEDPTAGIDLVTKLELYRQMKTLAESGSSIVLLSSDLLETILLCNRVYTMYAGRIIGEYHNATPNQQEQILADVLGRSSGL